MNNETRNKEKPNGKPLTPISLIDSLDSKKHLLLLYENDDHARMLEYRFIKNGLTNGENCVYTTFGDTGSIVIQMINYGISLKYFQTNLIRVYRIKEKGESKEEILRESRKEIETILTNITSPYRIVSRIVPDVSTKWGIAAELDLEEQTHREFVNSGGSILCPYDVSKIEKSNKEMWLDALRENHHVVIYISKSGKSKVFCRK